LLRIIITFVFLLSVFPFAHAAAEKGDWPHYGSDLGGTKYSPADQINRKNFKKLRVIWRYRPPDQQIRAAADSLGLDFDNHRGTPIAIDGVLYHASPYNIVSALDGASGEVLWTFDPEVWRSGARFLGNLRGVSYWSDGDVARIFLATSSAQLYSLDAATGLPDPAFGDSGRIDLGASLRRPLTDDDRWNYGVTAPPVICRDVVAVGSAIGDWRGRPPAEYTPVGDVQGFDARSGKKLWEFHTIPQQGEYGHETWENDAWKRYGAANVWASMTADEELGYLYLPVSTPSHDYYGGERPGANLFGDSIVCLKAETGERVWHFQITHHGLWDYDPPAPPILLDVVVDGVPRKIVALLTKQAFCFVFDRVTGEPIWPIVEKKVPPSQARGEKAWPTQPFPTKPAAFDRQGVHQDELIDFTPELRREALEIVGEFDYGPIYSPPTEKGVLVLPSQWGGADWAGGAADPAKGILYVPSHTVASAIHLRPVDDEKAFSIYSANTPNRIAGPRGLPLTKPPYGRITAIDLNTGEHKWMVPVGAGPVDHPALKGLDLPDMGWDNRTFVVATPKLLLAASQDPRDLGEAGGDHFVDRDAYLRAYDLNTGKFVGRVELPSNAYAQPMSYMAKGRQYVVVSVGNDHSEPERPPELVALAVPRRGEPLPPQGKKRDDAGHKAYYKALEALDKGDLKKLKKLLKKHDGLVQAPGFLDEWYEYPNLRGAHLLHHLSGEPQRARLPDNALEIARLLLDAGADANAVTLDSTTALELAARSDQLDWAELRADMIGLLMEAGADPNKNRGKLLWTALVSFDDDLAQILADQGAAVDLRFAAGLNRLDLMRDFFDEQGQLKSGSGNLYHPTADTMLSEQQVLDEALNYAANGGGQQAVAFLLEKGADIDAIVSHFRSYDRGTTALHKAVDAGDIPMIHFLVAQGADLLKRDLRWKETPYEWSTFQDNQEIIRLLKEYEEAAREKLGEGEGEPGQEATEEGG